MAIAPPHRPLAGPRPDRRLPFNFETPLRTYLHSAYPTGIVSRAGPLSGPVFNHHVQLFFPRSKLTEDRRGTHVGFLPGMGLYDYEALGYLRLAETERAWLLGAPGPKVLERLTGALAAGRYVHAYVDEYFIPGTPSHGRGHFRHALLLLGFDPDAGSFVTAAYRADGSFGPGRVPAAALLESLHLERHGVAKPRVDSQSGIDRAAEVAFQEIAPVDPQPEGSDTGLIGRQLCEYRSGRPNPELYRAGGPFGLPGGRPIDFPDPDGAYGSAVYAYFVEYLLRAGADGRRIDARATRVLLEHKALLGQALREAGLGDDRAFESVEALARRINFAAGVYNRGPNRQIAGQIAAMLGSLAREEEEALEGILGRWPARAGWQGSSAA
jgi:hypothetical protein